MWLVDSTIYAILDCITDVEETEEVRFDMSIWLVEFSLYYGEMSLEDF